MKASLFSLVTLIAAATAQTTSACAADYIVERCLETEKAKFTDCKEGDYDCQCAAYQAIVTCFSNCPNDSRKSTEEGQEQIYCSYATQFASTTKKAAGTSAGTAKATDATTTGHGAGATASRTQSASEATGTNGATDLVLNTGGVLAAVAGVVIAML